MLSQKDGKHVLYQSSLILQKLVIDFQHQLHKNQELRTQMFD